MVYQRLEIFSTFTHGVRQVINTLFLVALLVVKTSTNQKPLSMGLLSFLYLTFYLLINS